MAKSYCWSPQPQQRAQLAAFPLPRSAYASELGGALTFGKKHSAQHVQQRCAKLGPKWQKLKRSMAPVAQKQQSLYTVCWPKALHGINAVQVSAEVFKGLRSNAMKALNHNKAGANAVLRLTLAPSVLCDPEYYTLECTVMDFRRVGHKVPDLSPRWQLWAQHYSGDIVDGPFSVLQQRLNAVGWRVEPPFLQTHDGVTHHLFDADARVLQLDLQDAWHQQVARRVCHRATMSDLEGIDPTLSRLDAPQQTAGDQGLISMLQSGAFLSASSHAKFDLTKSEECIHCGELDTVAHWTLCQGYVDFRPDTGWPLDFPDWPLSLVAHGLPSRNPHVSDLKRLLATEVRGDFQFLTKSTLGRQHVFTDGSLQPHDNPWLRRGAWAALNSTTGLPIAMAPLAGLWQGIDAAEIMGLIAALTWALHFGAMMTVWMDSRFVVDSVNFLYRTNSVPKAWDNQTLWHQVLELLQQFEEPALQINWIPSHLDIAKAEDPFEEWFIHWNSAVDHLATGARIQWPTVVTQRWQQADQWHRVTAQRLRLLRRFFLEVAKNREVTDKPDPCTVLPDVQYNLDLPQISELLCVGWAQVFQCTNRPHNLPMQFCQYMTEWIGNQEDGQLGTTSVSFLEILFLLHANNDCPFPFQSSSGCFECRIIQLRLTRPTVAELIGSVRDFFRFASRLFGFETHLIPALNRTQLGVICPVPGIYLGVSPDALKKAQEAIQLFTQARPLRRTCDYARPI